jgi:hypothetical protein
MQSISGALTSIDGVRARSEKKEKTETTTGLKKGESNS